MKIAVIFGGKSPEHEISCKSAVTVLKWIDTKKHEVLKIGIAKSGKWLLTKAKPEDIENGNWANLSSNKEIYINPDPNKKEIITTDGSIFNIDCAFPILHGEHGEDGDIQGLLELMEIPYVGPKVKASACCMDKSFTKQMALSTGIKMAKHIIVNKWEYEENKEEVLKDIITYHDNNYPLFVKPCSTGSSVGVSKVLKNEDLRDALDKSLKYDNKAFVEEMIIGREIEVAVLGNNKPKATAPGEIISAGDFYDYDSKYNNPKSIAQIAANLSQDKVSEFKKDAIKLYKALNCQGMARVDFFLNENNEIIFNEINTIPGFTNISMYPKLWDHEGLSGANLVEELIKLAIGNEK